jgi:hypothetical protein
MTRICMESVSGRSSGLPVARLPLDGEVVQLCGYFGANAFGRGESFGIFALAPTIKPAGEYFTGPELRVSVFRYLLSLEQLSEGNDYSDW